MKTRYAIAAAAVVVSLAACTQTLTTPADADAPAGPRFDAGGFIGSGTYLADDGETTMTATVEGDTTGRNYTFGSGS